MADQKVKINAKDFGAKYRDKREVYHFLSHDCGAYIPSYDTVTIWHLRDLVSGQRLMINGKDIKHISVPQYEDLTIKEFLMYALGHPRVLKALPESQKETLKMPRQYIANLIHTLVGKPFADWVKNKVNQRHSKVADERELHIEMDPEIAAIYQRSQAVSGR